MVQSADADDVPKFVNELIQNGVNGGAKNGTKKEHSFANSSANSGSSSSSSFQYGTPTPPAPLLLHLSIPVLLVASTLSELLEWKCAFFLYILFRLLISDYGRRTLRTLPRDLKGLGLLIRIKLDMARAFRQNEPIHCFLLRQVNRHPDKECVVEVETGRRMNFAQFNGHANKYANLLQSLDLQSGEIVALFMENGIEFFASWLGASKLGVITAWINTNLKAEPLAHSIRVASCRAVLTTPTLLPVLQTAVSRGLLSTHLPIFVAVDGQRVREVDASMQVLANADTGMEGTSFAREYQLSDQAEPRVINGPTFQSVLCYIYTSGTTGTSKAAIIKHYRYFLAGTACGSAFGIRPDERLYLYLPMYHSAGGILGASQVIIRGCTACIRTKFSASKFWRDCARYDCTTSQYIGEICRYLLAQPPVPEEKAHKVRLMYGNGLRPQIWREFVSRFGISKIGELYGSTEGNSNLVNIDNHTGACGFMPIYTFLQNLYPIRMLKVDPESGELVRDAQGFCIRCRPGDTGEMVGSIKEGDPLLRFDGYVNRGDTQKKIMRDCLHPGDTVFTSGDILHWDRLGYLYFKDRRGDTFRWRGENVSTMEVEGVLQPLSSILDATVFGVQVPGREGRAGMIGVALVEGADTDDFLEQISTRVADQLAAYAIPVFLRICDNVDKTGTYKLRKTLLQRDGYNLRRCAGNRVFYWDSAKRQYISLNPEMQECIDNGSYTKI